MNSKMIFRAGLRHFTTLARCLTFLGMMLSQGWGQEDGLKGLEALQKKLTEKAANQAQQTPADPRQAQMAEVYGRLAQQLKMVQAMIEHGEYEKAKQAFENLGSSSYAFPPELQESWTGVFDSLRKQIDKLQADSMAKWQGEVDQLVKDTRQVCLTAGKAEELDPLLVRCAALQMRRQQQSNVLGERVTLKLTGASELLESWSKYLDYRTAGNAKVANNILRSLASNQSLYPILTVEEITQRMIPNEDSQGNVRTAVKSVFDGVKTPEDIPKALERINAYVTNPMNTDAEGFSSDKITLEAMRQAWESAKGGDADKAAVFLRNAQGGQAGATPYYNTLRSQITVRIIEIKAAPWTKSKPVSGEESAVYFGRILDELKAKNDYASMMEVMKLSGLAGVGMDRESGAIGDFLAAQRFEAANDVLSAIVSYRLVVANSGLKYAPIEQATAALKALQEKNPEAFKDYNGAMLQEVQNVQQQLKMLNERISPMIGRRPF